MNTMVLDAMSFDVLDENGVMLFTNEIYYDEEELENIIVGEDVKMIEIICNPEYLFNINMDIFEEMCKTHGVEIKYVKMF